MSGFLPDIANWALGGGAGSNEEEPNETPSEPAPTLTPAELRAQRLARMEALQQQQPPPEPPTAGIQPVETKHVEKKSQPMKSEPAAMQIDAPTPAPKKKAKSNEAPDSDKKAQRKRELLLKKVLGVSITKTNDSSVVYLPDVEDNIAEILATRLTLPFPRGLLSYLAQAYRKAADERSELGAEIQTQVVSYAATCLMEPDLFEAGEDAPKQLAQCLIQGTTDLNQSIVTTSFYSLVMDELVQQEALEGVLEQVLPFLEGPLAKTESILEEGSDGSPLVLVSALAAFCSHKKVADWVTRRESFLLPPAGSREAAEVINPQPNHNPLLMMLRGPSYQKRSGPALEKRTLLGLALRGGVPLKSNPAFHPASILRMTMDSTERAMSGQRSQLKILQEACSQLVMNMIKAGPDSRGRVLQWFTDALLVNVHASAMRPDPSKVSSPNLLLNLSVVLLKLCQPFVNDEKKQYLIDPGFVSAPEAHGGVFTTTGDDAVARLGEVGDAMDVSYAPKNAFIPQCFFLCARSFHLGIAPLLSQHEGLLRHISHLHWQITSNNRDLHSDPHFATLVSREKSLEVAVFQEEMIKDTLRFGNLLAKVLFEMDDDVLKTMPEDFVHDIGDILLGVAKLKPHLLRGYECGSVFHMVVKLLSSKYAGMVRNYNLRALLGDLLHEIFLPSSTGDGRRDVPSSLALNPQAGGQSYLMSDKAAQDTLAPSLLLLYGEVEHTGHYEKMRHRAKIAALIKYLWESTEHRPAFRRITQNKDSFIKFANGIMNETNTLIATVMQKLPEIREAQEQMRNTAEWGRLSEDEQTQITERLDDNGREVKHALPLCNRTLQMFGYLNTDSDIRGLFMLEELRSRLVTMLLHVLVKLVGSKGLDLKVENPEEYEFRPKEMLRDLCAIFALFASYPEFPVECAKSACDPGLLRSAVKTCRRLNLLTGESMVAFESLPDLVDAATQNVAADEALYEDAPDEFLDPLLQSFMKDPVLLPSGHFVDRATIATHLLNDPCDPFSREPMTIDDVRPATELKARMDKWLQEKRN